MFPPIALRRAAHFLNTRMECSARQQKLRRHAAPHSLREIDKRQGNTKASPNDKKSGKGNIMQKWGAILGCTMIAFAGPAMAQAVCTNNTPNPFKQAENWAHQTRPWASTNAVAVDSSDNIWVADRCAGNSGCSGANSKINPIWELSSDGKVLKNFGAGLFVAPHSLTIDRNGHLWVADYQIRDGIGNQVTELDQDGKVLLKLGKPGVVGSAPGEFNTPSQARLGPDGNIYVSESHGLGGSGNARIQVFSADGKYLRQFGSMGVGPDQFTQTHDFDFDSQGRMYIADRNSNRVEVYSADGKMLDIWHQFGRPTALAIDRNDNIYVADADSSNETRALDYNPDCAHGIRIGKVSDGKVVTLIPPPPEPGPYLGPVEGLAVDSHGVIYGAQVQAMDVVKYVRLVDAKRPAQKP
jgi:sugar lactone lactonase YvrE